MRNRAGTAGERAGGSAPLNRGRGAGGAPTTHDVGGGCSCIRRRRAVSSHAGGRGRHRQAGPGRQRLGKGEARQLLRCWASGGAGPRSAQGGGELGWQGASRELGHGRELAQQKERPTGRNEEGREKMNFAFFFQTDFQKHFQIGFEFI